MLKQIIETSKKMPSKGVISSPLNAVSNASKLNNIETVNRIKEIQRMPNGNDKK